MSCRRTEYDASLPFLDMSLSLEERLSLIGKDHRVHLTPTLSLCHYTHNNEIVITFSGAGGFAIYDYQDGYANIQMETLAGKADEAFMWRVDDDEGGVCRIGQNWFTFSALDGDFMGEYHTARPPAPISETDAKKVIEFFSVPD